MLGPKRCGCRCSFPGCDLLATGAFCGGEVHHSVVSRYLSSWPWLEPVRRKKVSLQREDSWGWVRRTVQQTDTPARNEGPQKIAELQALKTKSPCRLARTSSNSFADHNGAATRERFKRRLEVAVAWNFEVSASVVGPEQRNKLV